MYGNVPGVGILHYQQVCVKSVLIPVRLQQEVVSKLYRGKIVLCRK